MLNGFAGTPTTKIAVQVASQNLCHVFRRQVSVASKLNGTKY
jgi:hypothetical protein